MLDMSVYNDMECFPSYYFLYKPSMVLQPFHFHASPGLHIPCRDRAPIGRVSRDWPATSRPKSLNNVIYKYLFYSQRATGKHARKRTAVLRYWLPPLFMQSSTAMCSDGLRGGKEGGRGEDMKVDLCAIVVFLTIMRHKSNIIRYTFFPTPE